MSSMLKKTGGLAFKPKALGRRGGPASTPTSSQAPTAATSSSTTRAPTTEPLQSTVGPPSLTPPATNPSGQDVAPAVNVEQTATGLAGTRPVDGLPPTPEPTQASATPSNPKSTSRRQSQVAASTSEPNTASDAEVQNQVSEAVATTNAERGPYPGESRARTSTSRVRPDMPTASDAPEAATSSQSPGAPAVTAVTASQDPAAPVAQPKKKRSYTRRKPQATAEDGAETSTAVDGTAAVRKRARSQGRKRTARTAGESGPDVPAGTDGETSATPKPSKRRRRSLTPEDAVNIKVDHTAVKMSELTRDLGIGVPFKHADAIAERAREARNQARLRKLEKDKIRKGLLPDPGDDIHGSHKRDAEHEATKSRLGSSAPDGGNGQAETAGPGYIVVDGQIIINQQSLMIDNHASAEDMSMMRTVVEDDFTHLTTSASFMRASRVMGANSWTEDETEKFYNYLRMFGTDFETISHMFPGKNRRMVKLKFNREERQRPNRINAAVMARDGRDVSIDLDHYKEKRSNWQEADEIKKEHDALVAEHNVEVQRLKAERRAQGLVDDDDDDDGNNDSKNTSKEDGIVDGDADAVDKTADGGDTGGPAEADAADEQDGDLPDLTRADNIEHASAAIAAAG